MQDHRFGKCFFLLSVFYLCSSLIIVFGSSFSKVLPSVAAWSQFFLATQPLVWNCFRLSIYRIQGKEICKIRGMVFVLGCLASIWWIGLYAHICLIQPSNLPQISNETPTELNLNGKAEVSEDISLVFLYVMTWFYPALYEKNYGLVKFLFWTILFLLMAGNYSLNWIGALMTIIYLAADFPFLNDNFSDMIRRRK